MKPLRGPRFAVLVAAPAFAMVTSLAGTGFADLTVKGDQAAWRDVQAAYAKLNTLQGYRMKAVMPGGNMVVEVTLGGTAMHMVMHTANGDMENYVMGGQTRTKMTMPGAPAGWQCHGTSSAVLPQADPSKMQGTVDVARGQDTTIDGAAMHVYIYTVQSAMMGSVPAKTTLYVDAGTGLPRRVVVATTQGDQAMDYYDYDAPIKFTLPACGSAFGPAVPAA
jgi:hypothetical protein